MATQSDFMLAVNSIAADRGIDPLEVVEAIKAAIVTGFRNDYPEEVGATLAVDIDPEHGSISVFADKKVVDSVTEPATQISLADAQLIEKKLKVGDHVQVDITPQGDFGRVAAQAARQVILQKIRESEKKAVLKEFKDKVGDIEYAVVQRMDADAVLFEIRRAQAIMPKEDRIPGEFYKSGARMKVLIKELVDDMRGKQLVISRADGNFLRGLFMLEVPEIVSGSVEIKGIAREAGSRAKVAVASTVDGVDPIGSCVGQRGVRINAITNELKFNNHEEKIDIISWSEDEEEFIVNALSPAQVVSVKIVDREERVALVIVPDDQLSLAIGRDGQNVRLAAKLTGWKLDIEGETIKPEKREQSATDAEVTEPAAEKAAPKKVTKADKGEIADLKLGARVEAALAEAGIVTRAALKVLIDNGSEIKGVGPKSLEKIKQALG